MLVTLKWPNFLILKFAFLAYLCHFCMFNSSTSVDHHANETAFYLNASSILENKIKNCFIHHLIVFTFWIFWTRSGLTKILTKDGKMCISIYILNKIWPDKNSDRRWKNVDFWCHICHTNQTCQTMPDGWTFPDESLHVIMPKVDLKRSLQR